MSNNSSADMSLTPPATGPMKDFPCPLCSSDHLKAIYPDNLKGNYPKLGYQFSSEYMKTYRVVRCKGCGHMFCTPRHENLFQLYKNVEDPAYLQKSEDRIKTAKHVLEIIREHIPSGNLLDIGCATGDFLSVAKDFFKAEGLECSTWASDIAIKRGLTVHNKPLEQLQTAEKYDVTTLWGVIEHFEDPVKKVCCLKRILKKGGYVFLWTGDVQGLPAKILGRRWWHFLGQHIQFFSAKSLCRLFENQGFEKVTIQRYPYVLSLSSIGESLGRYPFIGRIFKAVFVRRVFSQIYLTLILPGEMLAIFRKK